MRRFVFARFTTMFNDDGHLDYFILFYFYFILFLLILILIFDF